MDRKTEVPGMYKVQEGIVINKDKEALALYKKKKEKARKVDRLEQEVMDIKTALEEIKNILKGTSE